MLLIKICLGSSTPENGTQKEESTRSPEPLKEEIIYVAKQMSSLDSSVSIMVVVVPGDCDPSRQ